MMAEKTSKLETMFKRDRAFDLNQRGAEQPKEHREHL